MINTQVATREMFLAGLVNQCEKLGKIQPKTSAFGLQELRDIANQYVLSSHFPTVKDEEWRHSHEMPLQAMVL